MRLIRCLRQGGLSLAAALSFLALAGCADLGISNPFSTTSDINDVYVSQFPDVPIPADMKSEPKNSLVTTTRDGVKVGLETFSGRVEAPSLANAMIHNMARQGWSLRGSITGKRTMQLHEKGQLYAIIYLYDQTMSTGMEVWVLNRLSGSSALEGLFELPSSGGADSAAPYSPPAGSVTEEWEGGVSSQSLSF